MNPTQMWIVLAVLSFIAEIFTPGFVLANIGVGALAGALVAYFDYDVTLQLTAFSVVTLLSYVALRPVLRKFIAIDAPGLRTNAQALIGRYGIVSVDLDPVVGGRVKIDGDDWRAVTPSGAVLKSGDRVRVVEIEGVTLTVVSDDAE